MNNATCRRAASCCRTKPLTSRGICSDSELAEGAVARLSPRCRGLAIPPCYICLVFAPPRFFSARSSGVEAIGAGLLAALPAESQTRFCVCCATPKRLSISRFHFDRWTSLDLGRNCAAHVYGARGLPNYDERSKRNIKIALYKFIHIQMSSKSIHRLFGKHFFSGAGD